MGERFSNVAEYTLSVSVVSEPLNCGSVMIVLTSSGVVLYMSV